MSNNIIPRNNCIWEKTIHVSRRATSYFVKGIIIIILTVQRSMVTREFVFKIRRRLVNHNLVTVECAYTNEVQIRIPILIPHRVWNDLDTAMHQ